VEARKLKGFIQFLVIGIIGLGLKALGMNFMVEVLELFYILAHIMTTLIVLVWNYMGRKILIFKGA
jgi:putative flippase GtrA